MADQVGDLISLKGWQPSLSNTRLTHHGARSVTGCRRFHRSSLSSCMGSYRCREGVTPSSESLSTISTEMLKSYTTSSTISGRSMENLTPVHLTRTGAFRELLNQISRGYSRYTSGSLPPRKTLAFVLKMHDRYGVCSTSQQRWRANKKGQASARLVLLEEHEQIHWWLLVREEGEGLVTQLETLSDAKSKAGRVAYCGYELVRETKKGAERPRWTWRMQDATVTQWRDKIRNSVRSQRDDGVRQIMHSLRRVPTFSGVRPQAYSLAAFTKSEWKRARRGNFPVPDIALGWQGRYKQAKTRPLT